jgi:hypothetical protein
MSRSERIMVGAVAVAAWTGLVLQADLSFTGMLANGLKLSDALIRFFSYFTILTNCFIAADCTYLFLTGETKWSRSDFHVSLESCFAVSIFFVSAGYTILLRHLLHLTGAALVANSILHYAVPSLFLLYWFIFASRHRLPWMHASWWAVYPFAYFLYALVQGWRTGLYPYPFIDAARIGYRNALVNGTTLLVLFWLAGFIFIALGRLHHRRRTARSESRPC